MSDILTRLLLKTDDFDRNLKKGGKSVSQFEQGISSMASKAGKAFAGVAVAVGAGTTAYETLNKIMNSSQTLSDGLNEKIAKAKGSVDEFFYSIGSGDWTNFLSGMDETIRKAGELYRAMDQLGNTQISYGYFSDKYDTNIEAAREKATNTSLGKEERERALKEWQEAINEKKKAADTLRGDLLIALKNSLVAGNKLNANDVSLADFEKVLSYDIANPAERERIKAAQKQLYEQYKIKYEALERQKKGVATDALFPGSAGAQERAEFDTQIIERQKELNLLFKDAIIFNEALVKWDDEKLVKARELAKEYNGVNKQLSQNQRALNTAEVKVNNQIGKTTGNGIGLPKEETINVGYKLHYTDVDDMLNPDGILQTMRRDGVIIPVSFELDEELPKEEEIVPKLSGADSYIEGLNGIASAFGSISNATEGSAASMLSWMSSIISASAAAVPAIMGIVAAKKAEANANAEAAVTGAASSVAGIPIVGWLMAGAAVASIIAAFASIPKFETGGIVPGTSYTGDKVLARLNSGEMVLNKGQQKALFEGGTGGGVSISLESARIQGADLYLALSNYMKRSGKKL